MTAFGDYTLVERIGQGGMAEIWLAKRSGVRGFEKPLAIKKILAKHTEKNAFIDMFVEEAKLTSRLTHQNIVQIYELGAINGEYFIAMEYVAGWDLLRILQRAASSRRPVPAGIAIRIVADACRGLDYAHTAKSADGIPLNIVHFDVSPSNILIGATGSVKVSDFGVARAAMGSGEGTANDRFRGKVAYMSPEQLENRAVDRRGDIFSAGIVLYETLTLKRLFRAASDDLTIAAIKKAQIDERLVHHAELPERVKEIIRKALARRAEDRYETAGALADDLEEFLFESRVRVTSRDVAEYVTELFGGQPTVGRPPAPPKATSGSWRSMSGAGSAVSEAQRGAPKVGGFFDGERAAGILARLCTTRATGCLLLTHNPVRKELFFARGSLIFSRSNLDEEHLPGVLLAEKRMDEARLKTITDFGRDRNIAFEAAALQLGALDSTALMQALTSQLERRLIELFRWRNGHFGFYEGQEPPKGSVRLDVDPISMLGRGLGAHMPLSALGAYFTRLGNPTVSRAPVEPFPIDRLRLSGRETRFLVLLTQKPSRVRDFLRANCKSDEDMETALRTLTLLYQTGHTLADGISFAARSETGG